MPSLASFQLTPPQDAREFEQLMRDYCNCIYPGMACLFARPGQKQYGVDVVSTGSNGVVAIQCKNYQDMSVSISMIDQWIQGAEEFKPEISHFIIAIGAKTDGEIQKYVLEKNQYRQSHNLFSVEVVYWEEISAFLKSDARILQRYYPFINTDGIQDQFDIAYSSLDIIRHDFVELILSDWYCFDVWLSWLCLTLSQQTLRKLVLPESVYPNRRGAFHLVIYSLLQRLGSCLLLLVDIVIIGRRTSSFYARIIAPCMTGTICFISIRTIAAFSSSTFNSTTSCNSVSITIIT